MLWPIQHSSVQRLPPVRDLESIYQGAGDITYKPKCQEDEILDAATSKGPLPYVVLTYRGFYLFDSKTGAAVSAHIRSDNSVEQYGSNEAVQVSPNGRVFAVKTSANALLVYSIRTDLRDQELLTVYSTQGIVLQNGYPIPRYSAGTAAKRGVEAKTADQAATDPGVGVNVDGDVVGGIMQSFLSAFKGAGDNEAPIYEYGLRLKLILNVQSPLTDFRFVSNSELLLVNSQPRAFQFVRLNQSDDAEQSIKFVLCEELASWYPEASQQAAVTDVDFSDVLQCCVWVNTLGEAWLVKKGTDEKDNPTLNGTLISSQKACRCLISHFNSLVYLALEDGTLLIYRLNADFSTTLLRTINKPLTAKDVRALHLSPHGSSVVVHYTNGWTLHSFLGNLNFSSYEFDPCRITAPSGIRFVDSLHLLLYTAQNTLLRISLTYLAQTGVQRPVLVSPDVLSVFRAHDRKADQDTLQDSVWCHLLLPLDFRMRNLTTFSHLRGCCASDDGTRVVLVGEKDVVVCTDIGTQKQAWHTLQMSRDLLEADGKTPVQTALWWHNHLVLGLRTQLAAFAPDLADFSYDAALWFFDFADARDPDEQLLALSVDVFSDRLLAATRSLNVYTWRLSLEPGLVVQRSQVYQLGSCFGELVPTIAANFRTIVPMGASDLLVLANAQLYYIHRLKSTELSSVYAAKLLAPAVEYVQKLGPQLLCVFDGSQLLQYVVPEDEQDLCAVTPIKIQVGNDIVDDRRPDYVINSAGTTPYPITVLQAKNIIFGIEVDCNGEDARLKLDTTKRDYLSDLVDHYIVSNIRANDPNALGISVVYRRLCRFRQFKFVLEVLMVKYIQRVYEHDDRVSEYTSPEYFDRLIRLIEMTSRQYEILLNCLKKTEVQYWHVLFTQLGKTPREVVTTLFNDARDYKMAAHYFTIMLNYEGGDRMAAADQELISQILVMLVKTRDYETSFEMVRFIKMIDDELCTTIVRRLEREV